MASRLGYAPIFSAGAVEFFHAQARRRQRKILDRAHELAADPFMLPDFRSLDAAGREICHVISDDFVFDFWVDHAVKQVVITGIDRVE